MASDQKRAFLAVVLSAIVLFGWQSYFAPEQTEVLNPNKVEKIEPSNDSVNPVAASVPVANSPQGQDVVMTSPSETFVVEREGFRAHFNNSLGLSGFDSREARENFNETWESKIPFQLQIITDDGQVQNLDLSVNVDGEKFTATDSKFDVRFTGEIAENGKFNLKINSEKQYRYRFILQSKSGEKDNRQIRQFLTFSKEVDDFTVGDADSSDGKYKWFAIDFNYHLFSLIMDQRRTFRNQFGTNGVFTADLVEPTNSLQFSLYYSLKDYDLLTKIGDQLNLSVDFGIFGILAVPILRGLQFFHKYIPNYGIGIILLTILMRLVTFPLQFKSFKSMKQMQKIQPDLQKLREKHKDDPQRMQKETMELFKRAGANPLGGCLPMLLQMPIFFAFYQVLYNAVELVGAPFYFWIGDLSIKDPIYVLPVLMAASMFLQQKITPSTTVDPTQKKIMLLMPLFFGFIMKDLPSGLVLYIFVSTLFGMAQQLIVYKAID